MLVKHYPGLLLSEMRHPISCTASCFTSARRSSFGELDMYEACGEGFPEPTEYLRQLIEVRLADGRDDAGLDLCSTTGRSRTCRGSSPGGFWSIKAFRQPG